MKKTGIFYGPVGGSTEKVANKIAELFGHDSCAVKPVRDASISDLNDFDNLIFGIATIGNETWDSEPLKSGWFSFISELENADISNKTVAIFGLGDHIRYADHFVDSIGDLYSVLSKKDLKLVGKVDASDYTFRESKAVEGDMFLGLPIDEEFEQSLTDSRIEEWAQQLKKEFK